LGAAQAGGARTVLKNRHSFFAGAEPAVFQGLPIFHRNKGHDLIPKRQAHGFQGFLHHLHIHFPLPFGRFEGFPLTGHRALHFIRGLLMGQVGTRVGVMVLDPLLVAGDRIF
jgi:hypothetical protein